MTIHGLPDGSVQLLAPNGQVAKTVRQGGFQPGADRSPFYLTLMLVALSLIVIGNGFFKPNISTIVGSLYSARTTGDATPGSRYFYWGINIGSIGSASAMPALRRLVRLVGRFRDRRRRHVHRLYVDRSSMAGDLPVTASRPNAAGPDRAPLIYMLSIVSVPLFWLIFRNVMNAPRRRRRGAACGATSSRRLSWEASVPDLPWGGHRHPDLVVARSEQGRSSR